MNQYQKILFDKKVYGMNLLESRSSFFSYRNEDDLKKSIFPVFGKGSILMMFSLIIKNTFFLIMILKKKEMSRFLFPVNYKASQLRNTSILNTHLMDITKMKKEMSCLSKIHRCFIGRILKSKI